MGYIMIFIGWLVAGISTLLLTITLFLTVFFRAEFHSYPFIGIGIGLLILYLGLQNRH